MRGERNGVLVEGFAGLPTHTRANTLGQYLFVNGRPVRDKLLIGVVRGAYADYLPRDRHPVVALFVTLDPREVDVNVHPAKAEVRFRDPGLMRAVLIHSLQEALGPLTCSVPGNQASAWPEEVRKTRRRPSAVIWYERPGSALRSPTAEAPLNETEDTPDCSRTLTG